MNSASTAILIFARSAHLDAASKDLPGGERVFRTLTRDSIKTAERTGLPCFHFDETVQRGHSFGERLGSAMQSLYSKGIKHLIVIGNDSPDLSAKTLLKAASQLESGLPVLGPSGDGGVYLIGLSRSHFRMDEFLSLPWQHNNLCQSMVCWLSAGDVSPVMLTPKMDLDNLTDFRNWLGSLLLTGTLVKQLIQGLVQRLTQNVSTRICKTRGSYNVSGFNKGSPAL